MNVYDFDNTIYRGDSTFGFILYLYGHRPLTLITIPRTAIFGLLYGLRIVPKLTFKTQLYHMFHYVKDMEQVCDAYVESHMSHIKKWYFEQQEDSDVIISASPYFLIKRFCDRLSIKCVMASNVDIHTGKYDGINCHGEEKVRRYYEMFPEGHIRGFWSDSLSDTPLAKISDQAYIVKGDEISPWPNK